MAAAQSELYRGTCLSIAVHLLTFTVIMLLQLTPAAAAAAPSLFKDVRPLAVHSNTTAGAAATAAQSGQYMLPQDVQVLTMPAPGGGVQSAAFEFQFDLEFLLTNPALFTVNLPQIINPVFVRSRPDLDGLLNSVNAAAGGGTPVPGQPSVINSAAVTLKSARLWTGQVTNANAGLSAVSLSVSTDTWNIYGEIRFLENRSNRWRMFKIVPALTSDQLAAMKAAASSDGSPLQPPPAEVKCIVFEYRRLLTTQFSPAAAITTEAAAASAAAADVTEPSSRADESAYTFRELAAPNSNNSSSSGSSSSSSRRRRSVLQSAADVVRQDVLLVYTGAAVAGSFNDEYVRTSMVNALALTNKAYLDSRVPVVLYAKDIRQVPWQASDTALQDITAGGNGLDIVSAWRDELSADLVSFWYSSPAQPNLCGEAWVGGDAAFAYSTVNMPCWSGYSFAGAVARNQGCRSNYYAKDYAPFADGMPGPYAFGLRRCGGTSCMNTVTTIGSLPCACAKQQEPAGFFSNPKLSVQIGTTLQVLGNALRADCARGITETAVAVSAYR